MSGLACHRVCSWCTPAHPMPPRCPACESLETVADVCVNFHICRTCGAYFELPPDAPVTHGLCDVGRRALDAYPA
jgi:hypothetical protein